MIGMNMKKYMCSLIIVLYGASWCGACRKQVDYFKEAGIAYEYKDVDKEGWPKGTDAIPYMVNTKTGKTHTGCLSGKDLEEFAI